MKLEVWLVAASRTDENVLLFLIILSCFAMFYWCMWKERYNFLYYSISTILLSRMMKSFLYVISPCFWRIQILYVRVFSKGTGTIGIECLGKRNTNKQKQNQKIQKVVFCHSSFSSNISNIYHYFHKYNKINTWFSALFMDYFV